MGDPAVKTIKMASTMAALALALAGGPVSSAVAQSLGTNIIPDKPSKTPEEIEREQALERQYKEGLKSIPDKKGSNDPWGAVRSAEPGPAAKAAKPVKPAKSAAARTPSGVKTPQ